MKRRNVMGHDTILVFDRVVKASELNQITKDFCGDVIITKKIILDGEVNAVCNLYVIGGIVRKYPISEFDINIKGDFYCYGEIHCHDINVEGSFYSQKLIYSKNIKVGENFVCDNKVDVYGSTIIIAGDLECHDIVASRVECLGKINVEGSISVVAGINNGY